MSSYCVRLLSDEHAPTEAQTCCCANAAACWDAIDEASYRMQKAGLPLKERMRRLLRGKGPHDLAEVGLGEREGRG